MDNPFKRTNYAKFCLSPSLDGTLPESVISHAREQLSIDFVHKISIFLFCSLDINSAVDQVQS